MDKEEASARLQATAVDGSFVVRESKAAAGAGEMRLVVKAENIVRHLKIDAVEVFNANIILKTKQNRLI